MISIIDRYILKMFLGFLLGGVIVFLSIFLSVDALSLTKDYPTVAGVELGRYYLYSIPEVAYQMWPIGCLVGVLFTLTTMNKGNELLALKASGMSLFRISMPMILMVLALSIVNFILADQLLPRFAQKKNYVFYNDIKKKPNQYSTVRSDRIWYRSKNTIFYIKTINKTKKQAQGLTLFEFNNEWDLLQMITASIVDLDGPQWRLSHGSVTLFTEDSSFPLTKDFSKKTIVMDEEMSDIQSTVNSTDVLGTHELKKYIQKNKDAGFDTLNLEVGYQAKFSFALSAFVMALLGIPFSVSRVRTGGALVNVGICLVLVFSYWTLYNSSMTLGYHGHLPPIIAAWGPNVMVALLASVGITRVRS